MQSLRSSRSADRPEPFRVDENRSDSLNKILVESCAVTDQDMFKATSIQQANGTRLERILLAHGWVAPEALLTAQGQYLDLEIIDPDVTPPTPYLIDTAGVSFCLSHSILPWRQIDNETWVAVSESGYDVELLDKLTQIFGAVRLVLCLQTKIHDAILKRRNPSLIHRAENCVPADKSCRPRERKFPGWVGAFILITLMTALWQKPVIIAVTIFVCISIGLLMQTMLKLVCFITALRMRRARKLTETPSRISAPLPTISIMVPLYKESDITDHLVKRLIQLRYPRELTDVILILEADDTVTRMAIEGADLPNWLRVIEVPEGSIKTKPRALNYGLNFCRGNIIGVWDAEDKPQPDQLHQIARYFSLGSPELGCIQGALDYYNPRTNWLSRCFTIEYASWFRVLLPAMARLGLVVPLGGTTCFFRREALQDVHSWDAWNVTEDADLGVRLARHGWQIEIVATTTDEEANCRPLPWIKQRSRWLKGYALTWAVHMRSPRRLWQDLGTLRFIGFQLQFLTLIGQIFFMPLLWSFWLLSFGFRLPSDSQFQGMFGTSSIILICAMFLTAEALNMVISLYAVSGSKHRHLRKWVATMYFYFPLGYFALWKAAYELFVKPFYWDKTAHGIFDETPTADDLEDDLVAIPLVGTIGGQDLVNNQTSNGKIRD